MWPYRYLVDLAEGAWNRALRSWFFRADLAGRPAYLAVDQETLAAIARDFDVDVADATESLSRAVRYRATPSSPLGWWVNEAVRWKLSGYKSDPPFLSVLAVTVLAATIVDDVNDRSYYRRLNALLGLPGTKMPRFFDSDVQQLWTYLNEWLTIVCHEQLGTATASNVGGLANVGWAQSQTLMRSSDRAKLPLFFAALGVQAGQLVDGDLLVRRLRSWSSGGQIISRRLTAVLQDARLSELLATALHSELATWDGTLRDEAGRVALRLLLAFHERSGELQAAVQVPEQLAGTIWRSRPPAMAIDLGSAGELQLIGVPITSQVLDGQPLQARPADTHTDSALHGRDRSPALTLFVPRREAHLLCPDDRLARWVEVPSALLHRPHLVLVRLRLVTAAIDVMRRIGSDVQPVRRIRCPDGWAAHRFTPARLLVIDGPLAALSPRGNELSALDGGLPISKRARLYLTAGAPDLVLDLREPAGVITIHGTEARPDATGRLRIADLRLPPGRHAVSVGGVHYQLTLADEFAEGPRDTRISLSFEVQSNDCGNVHTTPAGMSAAIALSSTSDATVSGAALWVSPAAKSLAPMPQPPRARTGGRHFALGSPGQVAEIHPRAPRWLQSLPVRLAPHLVDAAPALDGVPFPARWLLRVSQGGITVSAIHLGPRSQARRADDMSARLWPHVLSYIADAIPDRDDEASWNGWKQAVLGENVFQEPDQP